ncbi:MAG: ComF family protein [Candidatus Omnitrophica bacterium]|nr:ComF family protein [Candidatus Omnitrophota bacterium]MDD4012906.1 ComF family protein [Candidatus Omnitrophota bacterium]
MLKNLIKGLSNLITPRYCPVCGKKASREDIPLCRACGDVISSLETPANLVLPPLDIIWSCLPYEGAVRECIKGLKYRKDLSLVPMLESVIKKTILKRPLFVEAPCVVVPVPSHFLRRMTRGIDHAELIAGAIARSFGVPLLRRALLKIRATGPQTRLHRRERLDNLRNAFRVSDKTALRGKHILLADDVVTTGATLSACADELIRNGALSVTGITLARSMRV